MKTLAASTVTKTTSLALENGAASLGALYAALYTRVELVAVIGSIVAATAFCGMLGLFLSEAIPALRIPNIEGRRRLIANWLCGLLAYWTAPVVKAWKFPDADIELVAGACAGLQSILGVFLLVLIMRQALRRGARGLIGDAVEDRMPRRRKPSHDE